MDPIKEAFYKIKEDISTLQQEILLLRKEIDSLKSSTSGFSAKITPTADSSTHAFSVDPTSILAQNPTVPQEIRGLEVSKNHISTGNKGVPTDNSAYNQADFQTDKSAQNRSNVPINPLLNIQETLDSLDSLKKEVRLKFKRLTPQEMLIFTTIYSLENQGLEEITYKVIASSLNLTESSIRDYVTKLLQKGIPIRKTRLNNKKILLHVSEDLKKLASLPTIIRLREV
jgi:DNA-binding MarR family transcriptional regulator